MNDLFSASLTAASDPAAAETEGAKIGAAAERKRRQEAESSLVALLKSEERGGRTVRWERRVNVSGETRYVTMPERAGAYSDRAFLRLCNRAAAAAVGGWKRPEAVESVAAELCAAVLSETHGLTPRRGFGASTDAADPDLAYLTGQARHMVADALEGRRALAGLAAELQPSVAGDDAETLDLADAVTDAEGSADAYMDAAPIFYGLPPVAEWSDADWQWAEERAAIAADPLTAESRAAIQRVSDCIGQRHASTRAAILSTLRPNAVAAELANAGYAASPGAFRKAASTGRGILADALTEPSDALEAALEALGELESPEPREADLLGANGDRKPHAASLRDSGSRPIFWDYFYDADGNRQPIPATE